MGRKKLKRKINDKKEKMCSDCYQQRPTHPVERPFLSVGMCVIRCRASVVDGSVAPAETKIAKILKDRRCKVPLPAG